MDDLLRTVQPGVLRTQLGSLRHKVRELLDKGVEGRKPFPTHRIRILRSHARQVLTGNLTTVAAAVVERRRLVFSYTGRFAEETTRRRVSPQRLVYYRDQWYLDAWDEDKDDLRTFSIDGLVDIESRNGPPRDVAEEELDGLLTAGTDCSRGRPSATRASYSRAERARWVADETGHPDQTGRFLADGRYELTVPYADERERMGEILRHGPDVEAGEPASLVAVVRDRLARAAGRYPAMEGNKQ